MSHVQGGWRPFAVGHVRSDVLTDMRSFVELSHAMRYEHVLCMRYDHFPLSVDLMSKRARYKLFGFV